jgi:hypothetical protein
MQVLAVSFIFKHSTSLDNVSHQSIHLIFLVVLVGVTIVQKLLYFTNGIGRYVPWRSLSGFLCESLPSFAAYVILGKVLEYGCHPRDRLWNFLVMFFETLALQSTFIRGINEFFSKDQQGL